MKKFIISILSLTLLLVATYFIVSISSGKVSFDKTLEKNMGAKTWVSRVTKDDLEHKPLLSNKTNADNLILLDLPSPDVLDKQSTKEVEKSLESILKNFKSKPEANPKGKYTFNGKKYSSMLIIQGTDEEFAKFKTLKGKTKFESKLIESINSVQNRYFLGIIKYYEI